MEPILPCTGLNDSEHIVTRVTEHHPSQTQIASSTFPASRRRHWQMPVFTRGLEYVLWQCPIWLMCEVSSLVKRCTNAHTLRSIHPPQNRTKQDPNLSIARGACGSTSRDRRGIRQGQAARSLPAFASQRPHADLRSSGRATLTDLPLPRTRGLSLARNGEAWLVRGHARVPALASSRAR